MRAIPSKRGDRPHIQERRSVERTQRERPEGLDSRIFVFRISRCRRLNSAPTSAQMGTDSAGAHGRDRTYAVRGAYRGSED